EILAWIQDFRVRMIGLNSSVHFLTCDYDSIVWSEQTKPFSEFCPISQSPLIVADIQQSTELLDENIVSEFCSVISSKIFVSDNISSLNEQLLSIGAEFPKVCQFLQSVNPNDMNLSPNVKEKLYLP